MEASLLALQVHFHLTKGTAKKLTGRHRGASSWPSRPPGPQHEKKMRLYEDSKHAPVSATATAVGRSGKICASICFFSCLDTYLQMESEILHICICLGTRVGNWRNSPHRRWIHRWKSFTGEISVKWRNPNRVLKPLLNDAKSAPVQYPFNKNHLQCPVGSSFGLRINSGQRPYQSCWSGRGGTC